MPVIPGKNANGLTGFPTPDDTPVDTACIVIRVPADDQWVGVLWGAIDALLHEYNWYEWGALTPADAAAAWNNIYQRALEDMLVLACPPGTPTPFWDTVTDADDEYPAGELTPWYGTATVTYASPPEVTFVERLGIWAIAGFIAYSGAPGAALAFLTIADKFVIAFKTGDIGAVVDIIVDASRVGRYNTYSATPGLMRIPIALDPDSSPHQIYIVKDDDPDTTVQVVRDELNPNDVGVKGKRYNPDTDTAQIQNPDGTWTDNPAADTRTDIGQQFAPVVADDVRCQSASNMVRWIENLVSQAIEVMAVSSDAGGLLTFLIGVLLELGPFGWLIDIVLTLALLMFSAGITALAAAFTSGVYDDLLQILYCQLDADGKLTADTFAIVKSECASIIGGLANDVLQAMFFVTGFVGLNNAGTVDGGIGFDCSELTCAWCYGWDFTASDGGWDNCYRGTYSAGVGWVATVGEGFVASTPLSNHTDLAINTSHIEADIEVSGAAGNGYVSIGYNSDSCTYNHVGYMSLDGVPTYPGYGMVDGLHTYTWDNSAPVSWPGVFINGVVNDEGATVVIKAVRVYGTGARPDFTGGASC